MTSKELSYVKTIYEEKNFSQAAEKLGVTQSALSHCLNNIEKSLGQALFLRGSRNIVPTEAGKIYYRTAVEIMTAYDNMECKVRDLSNSPSGSLAVGFTRLLAIKYLHRVLPAYMNHYPNVNFSLLEESTLSVIKETSSKRLDCAIIIHDSGEHPYESQLRYIGLANDPCIVAVPHGTAFKQEDIFRTAKGVFPFLYPYALEKLSYIEVSRSIMQNRVQERIFNYAGINPNRVVTTRNWETARSLVKEGLGFALLPSICLDDINAEDIDCYRLPEELNAFWQISVIHSKDSELSLAAQQFVEMLKVAMSQKGLEIIVSK